MHLPIANSSNGPGVTADSTAQEIVAWSLERFSNQNMLMTSSFGMEGCALIHMYAQHDRPLTVIYLDTMFFFKETYELIDRMRSRYPHLNFVNRGTSLTSQAQTEAHGPELWKTAPDQCCKLRKVDPMRNAMEGVDVWITALRRSQSRTRANLQIMDWDWQFQLLKVCPLTRWERSDVWDYIKNNDVPYNALHEQGYPTVGCTHCTQPVEGNRIGEYSRAGRWAGQDKTECGLHGDGI
jgi:phosphoadenosine phosphosulfate reductase